jgi:hypothetical protein
MKPSIKTFSLVITLLLALITMSACHRETYPPMATPGAPDAAMSTQLTTPSAKPGLAADSNPATPQPDWEARYTEADPVTDSQELICILQDLYGRFMSQMDRPGWYRFYAGEPSKDVSWVHIPAPEIGQFDGLLELYDYPELYAPGFIWPTSVVGPDGQVGFTHGTESKDDYDYIFHERPEVLSFLDDLEPTLDNIGYFAGDVEGAGQFGHIELLRTIRQIQNPIYDHGAAHSEFSFEGWVGTYEDRPVFILKTTTFYSGVLPMMESGERPVREETYICYDLQNGGAIATKTDRFYQSGNSEVGDWWMLNYNQIAYFEALPEREQGIYDEALQRLEAFNQGETP